MRCLPIDGWQSGLKMVHLRWGCDGMDARGEVVEWRHWWLHGQGVVVNDFIHEVWLTHGGSREGEMRLEVGLMRCRRRCLIEWG